MIDLNKQYIYGFYHVCLINNWREIVQEQIAYLVSSGLYSRAGRIYVGLVGPPEEAPAAYDLFKQYPKFNVAVTRAEICAFEYPTLEALYRFCQANRESYVFYLHTKAVHDSRGNYWRQYMMDFNVGKWADCVAQLNAGFDMCGVKWQNADRHSPQHYSGNFWWARAAYINTLPRIDYLDKANRYVAEFWPAMGHPKAATLCQAVVDHYRKPEYK